LLYGLFPGWRSRRCFRGIAASSQRSFPHPSAGGGHRPSSIHLSIFHWFFLLPSSAGSHRRWDGKHASGLKGSSVLCSRCYGSRLSTE
jgi:hypothetical protein